MAGFEARLVGVDERSLKFEAQCGICWDGKNILDSIATANIAGEIVASNIFNRIVGVFMTVTDAFCLSLNE